MSPLLTYHKNYSYKNIGSLNFTPGNNRPLLLKFTEHYSFPMKPKTDTWNTPFGDTWILKFYSPQHFVPKEIRNHSGRHSLLIHIFQKVPACCQRESRYSKSSMKMASEILQHCWLFFLFLNHNMQELVYGLKYLKQFFDVSIKVWHFFV